MGGLIPLSDASRWPVRMPVVTPLTRVIALFRRFEAVANPP